MTTTPIAQPEFYLQAYGSISLERLDIAIFEIRTEQVDAICTRMVQALVLAGYHCFDLYDPKTETHVRRYNVEVPKPIVTVR